MKTHLVIGTSAAGLSVVQKIRQLDTTSQIICISDEAELPYNKCLLADYMGGAKSLEQMYTADIPHLEKKNITILLSTRVVHIDTVKKMVVLHTNESILYDTLFIGTGCSPIIPPLQQPKQLKNHFTFYSLADAQNLWRHIKTYQPKRAVIIGAGLSGLECADALMSHGLQVTCIEKNMHLLPTQIDTAAAEQIQIALKNLQGNIFTQTMVTGFDFDGPWIKKVYLASGISLEADLIVYAVGLQPNSELAQQAGLVLHNGSIVTNEYMQTSNPFIFSGGDVALVKKYASNDLIRSCTWPDAMLQGIIAAHSMVGQPRAYQGALPITSSAFFGLKFATCGQVIENSHIDDVLLYQTEEMYQKLLFCKKQLQGFLIVGKSLSIGLLKKAVLTQQIIEDPHTLLHR